MDSTVTVNTGDWRMIMKKLLLPLLLFTLASSSFSQLNNWEYCGIDSVSITAMYNFGNGHLIAGSNGEARPVYVSYNYGKTWDTLSMLPHKEIRRFEFFNNTLYACMIDIIPSIYMSKDSGKTWYAPDTLENGQSEYPFAMTYCMEAKDSIVIAGSLNKYARSTDYGDTWETLYLCDFFDDLDENEVGAMLSMVQFRDTLYVGTQCGVFATKDWGLSWEKRGKNSSTASSGTVSSIDMLDSLIMIGTNYGVYFTQTFGGTGMNDWELMFHNESGISELYNVEDSMLIFYNSHGPELDLFYSSDTGETWNHFYLLDSINTLDVSSFCHDEKYLYIGSYFGVWRHNRFDNVTINNANKDSNLIKKSKLVMLNNKTIKVDIKKGDNIRIDIFSLDGKQIYTTSDKRLQSGSNILRIENVYKKFAQGIYMIKLTINNEQYFYKFSLGIK